MSRNLLGKFDFVEESPVYIYSLQPCNRCLFEITSCKRSFTSAFKCVITSVPIAEQQSFYERSARISSLVSFSHSGSVRSSFGIRRIVIPRPYENQNARASPAPRPTDTRPRGLLVDQSTTEGKFIVLSIYLLDTCKM